MSFTLNKRALLTGLIAVSSVAQAQPEEGFTVAPSIGYYNMDNHRGVDNTAALSLGFGYQFGNPWAVELVYVNANSDVSTGRNIDVDQVRLDALYHLSQQGNLTPYLAAGVGTIDFSRGTNNALINAGGGVKYALNDALSLRADFRLINDTDEHELDNLTTLGLHYVFGTSPAKEKEETTKEVMAEPVKAVMVEVIEVVDADKDGVEDSKDQCLNTPMGVAVDMQGCALDSDKDGVADHKDQCLNTPMGVAVDMKGCVLDSDKDGVADHMDACPASAMGAKVDATGCYIALEKAKTIRLDVQFATNSVVIAQQYYPNIQDVAAFLKEYPEAKVVIEGHTDDRGSAAYNQALSQKRAQAVADTLTNALGVNTNRVSAVGYGEDKPLFANDSAANRDANRRVVAVISSK
ncbi:OmpA family protein [Marinomonas sp. IMCC 4694]|uniref:OmpA family protein n=1 Tax=Marinomonas sp. IMCC 4694 TaxID=2605432 RepID=UPI0011E76033|nr:OmpA family protein [Marinomonas sp. IMCC 4694]TYL46624.1 OmpA family protein [Marinomonas sp. IMCC 4694]